MDTKLAMAPWVVGLLVVLAGSEQPSPDNTTPQPQPPPPPQPPPMTPPTPQPRRRKLNNQETTELLNALNKTMDNRVRPHVDGAPVVVKCGVYVINFGSISEADMEYSMDILFRQHWRDERLAFPPHLNTSGERLSISPHMVPHIWTPDASFPLEKHASFHDVTVPNRMMKVSPNGDVIYSMRLTLTLACPMHLTHFPMDHQTCDFTINSYSYDVEDLVLQWFSQEPISVEQGIELPQFALDGVNLADCEDRVHHTGTFSCLRAQFSLTRQYGFFLLQTYIPSILIVIISWLSFWINKDAVPARTSLGVTTVLTMATQLSGSKASVPRISYPKAIDVWMVTCMIFVFAALIEYAFVNNLTRKEQKRRAARKRLRDLATTKEEEALAEDVSRQGRGRGRGCIPELEQAPPLDKVSRWLFPLAFILFNVFYWPFYTSWEHRRD